MNKQGRASRSKTQQTEQQDPAQIEVKPSKYLALLVALFPHCLIPPRPQQWRNPHPSLPLQGVSCLPPKQGRARPRRKEPSNPAQISAQGKILIRKAANPGPNRPAAEYRAKCLSLPRQPNLAGDQESSLAWRRKKRTPPPNLPVLAMGSNECLPPLRSSSSSLAP